MKKLYKYVVKHVDSENTMFPTKGEIFITKVTDRYEITEDDIKREIIHQIFHDRKDLYVSSLKEIKTIRVNHIPKT